MDIVSWALACKDYDQDAALYIDPTNASRSLSAAQSRTLVRQIVSGLAAHGLSSGDAVCILSFNDINYTSLALGIIGAGGCFTGANPGYTTHEVVHHIRVTEAKFLLTGPKQLNVAIQAAEECGLPDSRLFVLNFDGEDIPSGHQSWTELLKHGEKDWVNVDDPDNTTAAYFSTSGTSGLPKAAIIPHSYLVSQGDYQEKSSHPTFEISTIIALPPFHAFTIPLQHLLPLRTGTPCYVLARFEESSFLQALEDFQITQTAVVPPLMVALSKSGDKSKFSSLRRIYTAGSCASDGMQQQLYSKLHHDARIEQVFGMTECGWATNWQRVDKDNSGSIGQPMPGYRLRISNESGNIITADNKEGEIQVYVPHPMKGYLDNDAATAEALTEDGWVRTGDVGYVQAGNYYIIDRIKDLIKVRGWQVSPAEIETALLQCDNVLDAAVIGIADHKSGVGELPMAFIVRSQSCNASVCEESIRAFLATRLARYKAVEEIKFVDHIPRNGSGKILRHVLRTSIKGVVGTTVAQRKVVTAYSSALKRLRRKSEESIRIHLRRSSAESMTSAETVVSDCGPATPPAYDDVHVDLQMIVSLAKRKRRLGGRARGVGGGDVDDDEQLEPFAARAKRRRSLRIAGLSSMRA